jgi:serine/threonine-protein kinase
MQRAQQLGRYHLLDRIAFGGMAEIFRAKTFDADGHAHLVAVKRILSHLAEDEDFIQMLIDEARVASLIDHRNIARVYELSRAHNELFIAMEWGRRERSARHPRSLPQGLDAAAGARGVHRQRGGGGAAGGAREPRRQRQGHRPRAPRRVAVERDLRLQRRGQALRLRHRQDHRLVDQDQDRHHQGQGQVHEPRAGARAAAGSPVGHLLARIGALRIAD